MNEITCQFRKVLNPEAQFVTVGERFQLLCDLSLAGTLQEPIILEVPPELKYHIQVLRADLVSDHTVDLSVISAVVGNHSLQNLKLNGIPIRPISLHVQSVQDPANPVQVPYGPMMVDTLLPPLLPMVLLLLLILGFFVAGLSPWYRKKRYQKQMALFHLKCRNDLSPLDEFFRSMRELKKNEALWNTKEMLKPSSEVQQLFQSYVLAFEILIGRTFCWPLTELKPKEKSKYLSLLAKIDHPAAQEIMRLFFEIERNRKSNLKGQDLAYMIDWAIRLAPEIALLKRLNG